MTLVVNRTLWKGVSEDDNKLPSSYTRRHKAIRCFLCVCDELFCNVYFNFLMFFLHRTL
jgi:hypothetical protein